MGAPHLWQLAVRLVVLTFGHGVAPGGGRTGRGAPWSGGICWAQDLGSGPLSGTLLNQPLGREHPPYPLEDPAAVGSGGFPGAVAMKELTSQMGKPSHPVAHRTRARTEWQSQATLCRVPWAQIPRVPVRSCLPPGSLEGGSGSLYCPKPPACPSCFPVLPKRGWSRSRAHPPAPVLLLGLEENQQWQQLHFLSQ